jgi:predicted ArsR family transcriptional regulator
LQRLDTNHVTAQGLAEAHRLEARSARRLLAQLERAQALQYSHEELVGGRGRPRKVYTLDFDRLAELAVSFEEGREG